MNYEHIKTFKPSYKLRRSLLTRFWEHDATFYALMTVTALLGPVIIWMRLG